MSRLITKKIPDDTKLTFSPMGKKLVTKVKDAPVQPKKSLKKKSKVNRFAKKAAATLVGQQSL